LKKFHEREEAARWRQERIAQYEKRILDLEARLKYLEQKRLSVQNPYLPRPAGSEEDPSEKGLSGPELLARIDREVEGTTEQLEKTRADLAAFLQAHPE
jgi:hypothetical protein